MKGIQRNVEKGFSLVEVTIAMAIAAVALVTLIGLIPQGMDTMKEAGDEAIEARIHQQLLNELQMADFDSIGESYDRREFYYDAQGEEIGDSVGGSSARGSFEHIYTARLAVPGAGEGSMPGSVGGSSFTGFSFNQGDDINSDLRVVVIEIAAVGGRARDFDFDVAANRKMISTYQTYVVKTGRTFNTN